MSEGYTLKEMVQELRKDNKEMYARQQTMEGLLTKILEQTTETNGKVAANQKNIKNLQDEHKTVKNYFAAFGTVLTVVWTAVTFLWK